MFIISFPFKIQVNPGLLLLINFNILSLYQGVKRKQALLGSNLSAISTLTVCSNATVRRNHKIRELRIVWEKRGLFLFYPPPYSSHLNIAQTLWSILKGKWIRPLDYVTTDSLFYSTNRALAAVAIRLFINYSHIVA